MVKRVLMVVALILATFYLGFNYGRDYQHTRIENRLRMCIPK